MFGFRKNEETRIEPEFDAQPTAEKSLADILGAAENDTNITAGVDAILDEDGEISETNDAINHHDFDFGEMRNFTEPENENNHEFSLSEPSDAEEVFDKLGDEYENSQVFNLGAAEAEASSQPFKNVDDFVMPEPDNFASSPDNNETSEISDAIFDDGNNSDKNNLAMDESVMSPADSEIVETATPDPEYQTMPDFEALSDMPEVGSDLDNIEDDLSLDDILGEDAAQNYSVDDILQSEETLSGLEETTVEETPLPDFAATDTSETLLSESSEPVEDNILPPDFTESVAEPLSLSDDEPAEVLPESSYINDDKDIFAADTATETDSTSVSETEIISAAASEISIIEDDNTIEPVIENEPETGEEVSQAGTFIPAAGFCVADAEPDVESRQIQVDVPDNLWQICDLSAISDNPEKINSSSGLVIWSGDKYQNDIKVLIDDKQKLHEWSLALLREFSVPLDENSSEIIIEKDASTIRCASLMCNGAEKLKIFNQRSYKFVTPQSEFFTVQGNVICGRIDKTFSLRVSDYLMVPLTDKLNRYIHFNQPASGFIVGPNGVKVFFCQAKGIAFETDFSLPEPEVFEYIPSIKDFDNKYSFVFDDSSTEQEFTGDQKRKSLTVNVGASLYGWNVRFDNEAFMSLRDALEYQKRYKRLPSPNGELIHGSRTLKFFALESLKIREKVMYYAYGKMR